MVRAGVMPLGWAQQTGWVFNAVRHLDYCNAVFRWARPRHVPYLVVQSHHMLNNLDDECI